MSIFRVGQRVRFVRPETPDDPESDDLDLVGHEGVVIAGGRMFHDDRTAGYDCVASFLTYGEYCAWDWQLEPIQGPGVRIVSWSDCLWQPEGEVA